jgi:hypothetical protein
MSSKNEYSVVQNRNSKNLDIEYKNNRVQINTSERVKILKLGRFWNTPVWDDTPVVFQTKNLKTIFIEPKVGNYLVEIVDLNSQVWFQLECQDKKRSMGHFSKVIRYLVPAFGLHFILVAAVATAMWKPLKVSTDSNSNSETLSEHKNTESPVSGLSDLDVLPRVVWYQGGSLGKMLGKGQNRAHTAAISRFGRIGNGVSFVANTSKANNTHAFAGQIASQKLRFENTPESSAAPVQKLSSEQAKRVRTLFKTLEKTLGQEFLVLRKSDSSFSASIRYEVGVNNAGYGFPVRVIVEGGGNPESKIVFKEAFERIVTKTMMGKDIAGVTVMGESVFIQ